MELFVIFVTLVSFTAGLRENSLAEEGVTRDPAACLAERDGGTCEGQQEAWYYKPEEDRCYFFVYSGCGGNANRFASKHSCEDSCQKLRCPDLDCPANCTRGKNKDGCTTCSCTLDEAKYICSQPVQSGYCRAIHHKWAWNPDKRTCYRFVYGGCGGNENSFETEETCRQVCSRT